MIPLTDLERIANGGHWDSVQAPQIARELIAAREYIAQIEKYPVEASLGEHFKLDALKKAYDAAREARP